MIAAREGNLEVVRALIAAGANVNAADSVGLTAMSYAIRSKDPEKIATVYEYGGRLSDIDKEALEGADDPTKACFKRSTTQGERRIEKRKVSQIYKNKWP